MNATPTTEPLRGHIPANDRLKESFSAWLWSSIIAATVLHFGVFALWPTLTAEVLAVDSSQLEAIDIPDEIVLPEPPQPIAHPATPIMATFDVDEDVTIERTSFDENPVETLPPPPEERMTELSRAKGITPFTSPPTILNEDAAVRAMERAYPAGLRDAGIGGTVYVRFFIDEAGTVQEFLIDRSSGHEALDEAALSVAKVFRFSPALNRDQRVAVWVSFPVKFEVRK